MAKYIDREIATKIIDNYAKTISKDCLAVYQAIRDIVDTICPAVEAKPIVHAHWEKYDDGEFCYCSHCGKPAAEDDDVSWHGYCPVCGA